MLIEMRHKHICKSYVIRRQYIAHLHVDLVVQLGLLLRLYQVDPTKRFSLDADENGHMVAEVF